MTSRFVLLSMLPSHRPQNRWLVILDDSMLGVNITAVTKPASCWPEAETGATPQSTAHSGWQ